MAKKILKILLIIIGVIVLCAAALILWLTVTEFNPPAVEDVEVKADGGSGNPVIGDELDIMSWNIGYAGLGKDADFFMDGGDDVKTYDSDGVSANLLGIYDTLYGEDQADIFMLQEVDKNSARTYGKDETSSLGVYNTTYALNYSCKFVPYPIPPMGRINSGLMTTTDYEISSAERISLPCPFKWPVSAANLKRCLLVSYLPISGSDSKLVIVNLHLEAYDDGAGKIAQTNQLKEFIQSEYEKGNYVIAGGDFNQIFPGGLDAYPNTHKENWEPGVLTDDIMPEGWTLAYDLTTPSCRLLNQPYDPDDTEDTQYYVIDGFILSPNVELLNVKTVNAGFAYADHNPVRLSVRLAAQ